MYWIESDHKGKLAIAARPRGGELLSQDIESWHRAGIRIVVVLLMADERRRLDLEHESDLLAKAGIEEIAFPITDHGVPDSKKDVRDLASVLKVHLDEGRSVLAHCFAGIGRSSLVAAAVLVLSDVEPKEAFARISAARGLEVPDTQSQRDWMNDFFEFCRR